MWDLNSCFLGILGLFGTTRFSAALDALETAAIDADGRGRIESLIWRGLRSVDLSSTAIFFGAFFFKNRNKDVDCTGGFL